jgi:formamidopyrimidine-DNA glycosylase
MPELPEVETIKNDLSRMIVGQKIEKIIINNPGTIKGKQSEFIKFLKGSEIAGLDRLGKTILINFKNREYILLFHLKMTGQLVYCSKKIILAGGHEDSDPIDCETDKYKRLEFQLSDEARLIFNDLRKFGYARLVNSGELEIIKSEYGPDVTKESFNAAYLYGKTSKSKAPIKALLLNQKIAAGIGNIYADEILFASRIFPGRPASGLAFGDIQKIVRNTKTIINKAIKNRGTTFSNYVDANGKIGGFLKFLKVYAKKGGSCTACGGILEKKKIAGRGTHYCRRCQK